MTIRELLNFSQSILQSESAKLDGELLLAFCLARNRTYLYTWPEQSIDVDCEQRFRHLLTRRVAGEPIAYLIGRREFWSLSLAVNNSTLIPRPETERLVEVALELLPQSPIDVLDLGTGSGAIALALAKENPTWSISGVDIDDAAVQLATNNARELAIHNVKFFQSDWFAAVPTQMSAQQFDAIVSNPPYIDIDDPHLQSGDVRFEPQRALVAEHRGLAAFEAIVKQAPAFLKPQGWLLFEHGYEQGAAVRALLASGGFDAVTTWRDWGDRERISGGKKYER